MYQKSCQTYFCYLLFSQKASSRNSPSEVFLGKGVLKIYIKFTGDTHAEVWIQITLWNGCSPVNLLHIFRTPFYKNTHGGLLNCSSWMFDWVLNVSLCVISLATQQTFVSFLKLWTKCKTLILLSVYSIFRFVLLVL